MSLHTQSIALYRARLDILTGLLTKESLYLAFQMELERCQRYGMPISVLMMDLDFFRNTFRTYWEAEPTDLLLLAEL